MKTPFSILNTPGKRTHMRHLQQKARMLKMQVQRVTARLEKLQEESTVATEEDLSGDLIAIMTDGVKGIHKLSATSFQRMFWEQQVYKLQHIPYSMDRDMHIVYNILG